MTIGKRLAEGLVQLGNGDAEAALIPVSIAMDATAQKFYGKPGRGSYKTFIHDNLPLITKVALNGPRIENLHLAVPAEFLQRWPEMKTTDNNTLCSIQEIFYHVVRCGLVHEAELIASLEFQEKAIIRISNGKIILPRKLILGFIVSVCVCAANKDDTMPDGHGLNISGYNIPFNALWGKKDQLMNLYNAMDAIWSGYDPPEIDSIAEDYDPSYSPS